MATILIVDDEFSIRKTLGMLLKSEGYTALEAADLSQAKRMLQTESVDLVITDMRLGQENGMDLLGWLRANGSEVESIIMTAYGSIENAVSAMKLGAYDYLTKPINPDELLLRVNKVLENKSLREEEHLLRERLQGRQRLQGIVAESEAMRRILQIIERISEQEIPVLITGETGVGKEVIARAIHNTSARANGPFVPINCCTLPEDLLDSELFGHIKGAFTGAISNKMGLFREADGGTLFLDEIGDIGPRLQVKLLRVLQEGEVRPVGGGAPIKVNVRVISATNSQLESAVDAGQFRSDLLFRLNVLPITIPPLRERRDDIAPLVEHFLQRLRDKMHQPELNITPEARRKLMMYDWPGNVRQLENIIERSFALYPGPELDADEMAINMPLNGSNTVSSDELEQLTLFDVEIRHIQRVLAACENNQVAAARVLGISRSTLRRKLEQVDS
ncbi:MAG: sigma-54 dependent transcriptional regulator [Gammaproteobacteria bacterium]